MTTRKAGFFLEAVSVTGKGLPPAELSFSDGLNVVSGASDTGKSYIVGVIDFLFGASKLTRVIEQAKPYQSATIRIRSRVTDNLFELQRSLAGGDIKIRELDGRGHTTSERTVAAKHSAEDPETLSAFLLELSGFNLRTKLRKNKIGDTRSLSFRDVAFLVLIEEARIIAELPPHLSGNPLDRTVESEVLKLLVSGRPSAEPLVAAKKTQAQSTKAQLDLVQQLVAELERRLSGLQVDQLRIDIELSQIDQSRTAVLASYDELRVQLNVLEDQRAEQSRNLRTIESRLFTIESLRRRFELLNKHYDSDISRMSAVREAGSMLSSLPATNCPVCGALPEHHNPNDAAAHFRHEDVQLAASAEIEKTKRLQLDLQNVLLELAAEEATLRAARDEHRTRLEQLDATISREAQPRMRESSAQLQQQNGRRDTLVASRTLMEQLQQLRLRERELSELTKRKSKQPDGVETAASTAEMDDFATEVQAVLTAWRVPETGRVVFAEKSQDLVIDGQPRASHGKGVRALTCSAFVAGLMRHCMGGELAHPGLVILDSPLVAYREPDKPGSEGARIRAAGVKEAFYASLAEQFCIGQVLVFENEDPPVNVQGRAIHHHFTKTTSKRYGFFPR